MADVGWVGRRGGVHVDLRSGDLPQRQAQQHEARGDVDWGRETRTPSRGEGTCTIERVEAALTLDCEGIYVEGDYEVSLPARFERKGDVVEVDRRWTIPMPPRTTTHVEIERGDDEAVAVVVERRFHRVGDTWCLEVEQGTGHPAQPGVERTCFFAAGGLASYSTRQGSAATGLELHAELAGPGGLAPTPE